jgi:hypothetical protein
VASTGANQVDQEEKRIRVAVEANFAKPEHMTAGFPFFPKAIAGAREKVDLSSELGLSQGGGIKVTEHQYFAGAMVLNDAGNKTTKFFEREFQESLPKSKNPLGGARRRADQSLDSISARQTMRGARNRDDGDGVDAPGKSF